jgi:hypothetical protein
MPANTQADNDTLENNQQLLLHFTASTAYNYQASEIEELSSITSLNSDMSMEAFEVAFAELSVLTNKDLYRGKLDAAVRKYKSYFPRFFGVHCLNEAENFITNLPKVKYDNINCSLVSADGCYDLEFSRINQILQDPHHNITINQVINLANKLGVGKIKATYTGVRSQLASFGDCGGYGYWNFNCYEKRAWADYDVTLSYEHGNVSVALISLKFANRAPTYYCHIGGEGGIFTHTEGAKSRADVANGMAIGDFLKAYWTSSSLVDDSIVTNIIPEDTLQNIIKEVAKYVLANTSDACKQFKIDLLNNKRAIYSQKLNKLDIQYQLIMKYARLAGIEEADLDKIPNPLVRADFDQDLINFSLAECAPDGSESLPNKYRKIVDNFKQQLEKLLSLDVDSDISSDEEQNPNRPRNRM